MHRPSSACAKRGKTCPVHRDLQDDWRYQALLSLDELAPTYNSCSEKIYIEIFQRASKRNEERVRRDLTPHIVPSAELLHLVDGETTLENVREEMSGDWTNQSARRYSAKARLCVH